MPFRSIFCCGRGSDREELKKKQASWRVFSLKELHSATNNFNYDNKLGEGGIGSVYWGQLWDGSQIAVKRLKVWRNNSDAEFATELEILGRIKHKNLLSIRGYCSEGQERLIVHEYMPNLSLYSHLHGHCSTESLLDWKRRMTIAIGSAEGIAFLHHQAVPRVIHRDIKASNVLLDSDFLPHVSDFGYTKLIPDGGPQFSSKAKEASGYLAPEYSTLGQVSESGDVYSFGILLLELATGKKPLERVSASEKIAIVNWTLPLACERKYTDLADPRLKGKYEEEELIRVVLVGLLCAQSLPEKRPSMVEVLEFLKESGKHKIGVLEDDELFKGKNSATLEVGEEVKHAEGDDKVEDNAAEKDENS